MTEIPDTATINAFNTSIIDEFRSNDGKVGGQFEGANLLLLHTTGAKSGQPRISPLAYFRVDGKLIIIGSFAGAPVSPAWVHNLRANPAARVEIGTDAFDKVAAAAPGFAEYQSKTSRVIPLFELRPV
jgi:hypothetical protein